VTLRGPHAWRLTLDSARGRPASDLSCVRFGGSHPPADAKRVIRPGSLARAERQWGVLRKLTPSLAHFALRYARYGATSASKRALGWELFPSDRSLLSKVNRMSEGTIKRITDKGFGFIETAPGKDLFFHMSACEGVRFDDLQPGQRVSFVEGQGPKGPRAENVKLI
jgi:CspA family cold shock protein